MHLHIYENDDSLRSEFVTARIETEVNKIARHNSALSEVKVILDAIRDDFIASATVHIGHQTYHAEGVADNLYKAIDLMGGKIDRIARDEKSKRKFVKK